VDIFSIHVGAKALLRVEILKVAVEGNAVHIGRHGLLA
jgi:hypothetical protein